MAFSFGLKCRSSSIDLGQDAVVRHVATLIIQDVLQGTGKIILQPYDGLPVEVSQTYKCLALEHLSRQEGKDISAQKNSKETVNSKTFGAGVF